MTSHNEPEAYLIPGKEDFFFFADLVGWYGEVLAGIPGGPSRSFSTRPLWTLYPDQGVSWRVNAVDLQSGQSKCGRARWTGLGRIFTVPRPSVRLQGTESGRG